LIDGTLLQLVTVEVATVHHKFRLLLLLLHANSKQIDLELGTADLHGN
jgi:hypothetical protein